MNIREHTDAVIAALSSFTVGDAVAPDGAPPYVVVYPIRGGDAYGDLDDPHRDAELIYQVTCVGVSREQAEWLADGVRDALLAGLSVTGRSIPHISLEEGGPGVIRDDGQVPPIWYSAPRFRVFTTPA